MIALVWLLACGDTPPEPVGSAPIAARPAEVAPPAAPPEHLGLGRPASAERIALWDIDVNAKGEGLPPGSGTVAEGREIYKAQCAACHGLAGEGGVAPKLVGPEPKTGFADDYKVDRTIGNWWPHATTVYEYVHRAMPQTAPGSLSPEQTYALTAFLLAENGIVPQDFVADAGTLPKVKMGTTVEFVLDDRGQTTDFR